jgi:hypothetical protein
MSAVGPKKGAAEGSKEGPVSVLVLGFVLGIGVWRLEDEHCAAARLRMLVHTTNAVRTMMDVGGKFG